MIIIIYIHDNIPQIIYVTTAVVNVKGEIKAKGINIISPNIANKNAAIYNKITPIIDDID